MAIYHLTAKTGSRSGGQSARAKADYIQREGKYARDMDEVLHAESGHMPEFVERPADYWDAATCMNAPMGGCSRRSNLPCRSS